MRKIINGFAICVLLSTLNMPFRAYSQSTLSKDEVKQLITNAKTAEDHHQLAAYFNRDADKLEAEAVDHEELAKAYAKNPNGHESKHPMSASTAAHCRYFAQAARKAAAEDRAIAASHEQMAKAAQGSK